MFRGLSILVLTALIGCACNRGTPPAEGLLPQRIVSFAPSITETVYALGCGGRVVGVSTFCNYPKEVKSVKKVGGFADPNYEQLLRLKPDLVITKREHSLVHSFCAKHGIRCLGIDNDQVDAILGSIRQIGEACGAQRAADSLVEVMRSQLDAGSGEGPRPRILFCIDRAEPGSGRISSVFVAGVRTFYTELMQRAGAANAYPDSTSLYPSLSTEGILAVNPDIIVDVTVNSNVTAGRLKADWAGLKIVPAVRRGMVFSIAEPYMTVPGPRIILILEKFRGIVAEYHRAAKNVPASEQQADAY